MLVNLRNKRRAVIALNGDALIDGGQRAFGKPNIDDRAVDRS